MSFVNVSTVLLCDYFIQGELLTVAPWAARSMPGLFALNERIILNGFWKHGLFVFAAVGAYNVGSIFIDGNEVWKHMVHCTLLCISHLLSCDLSHVTDFVGEFAFTSQ